MRRLTHNELCDWMGSNPHALRLLERWKKTGQRRFRMRWKKRRFLGKIHRRTNWEYRRLYLLACGLAGGVDFVRLDEIVAYNDALVQRLVEKMDAA